MPHDKNGVILAVGDRVTVEFTVTSVSTGDEYCNVNLESVEPMYPGPHKTTLGAVNTRQTVKVSE